jgi:hypothetical protein
LSPNIPNKTESSLLPLEEVGQSPNKKSHFHNSSSVDDNQRSQPKQNDYFTSKGQTSTSLSQFMQKFNNNFLLDVEYIKNNFQLMKAESVIDYSEAYFRCEDMNLIGILVMTDYKLMFKFKDENLHHKLNMPIEYFNIPLFGIAKVDKSSEKKNFIKFTLELTLKDCRVIKFIIISDQLKFYANLNNLVFHKDSQLYYLFTYKYKDSVFDKDSELVDGWKLYNPIEEYLRQGINFDDENCKLRLTKSNLNYSLCATYPNLVIVPRVFSDNELKDASAYRTKNRFPVLSYVYNRGNKKSNFYGSIWRSSQTKSGLTGQKRSTTDEKLLKLISELTDKLVIYDARPFINALANRVRGGGYENIDNYTNAELHFCEIQNIHDARSALNKLCTMCCNEKM